MSTAKQAWERQPGESARAFEAFQHYRDAGADRSNAKTGQALGKSKTLIDSWSSRWEWVRRVEMFDAFEDEALRKANLAERRRMMRRISGQAMLMQKIALNAFKKLGDNPNLSPSEATHLVDVGARLEMRSRGMPEDGDNLAAVIINVAKREPEPYRAGMCAPERRGPGETK